MVPSRRRQGCPSSERIAQIGRRRSIRRVDGSIRSGACRKGCRHRQLRRVRRQIGQDSVHVLGHLVASMTPLKNGASARSRFNPSTKSEKTLIVFGTTDDEVANRRSAEQLQRTIRVRWSNQTIPIVADRDVTEEQIKNHHLVLIRRPDSNLLTKRFREALPVSFGPRSFRVGADQYAHCGSGVLAAADNPTNARFSIVVLAGFRAPTRRLAYQNWSLPTARRVPTS